MTAETFIDSNILLESFVVASLSRQEVFMALEMRSRYQIAYWDALILSSALHLGCHTVLSEDLNDGQHCDGVVVVNPFSTDS